MGKCKQTIVDHMFIEKKWDTFWPFASSHSEIITQILCEEHNDDNGDIFISSESR
jgi:hypothetical protein